MPTSKQTFHEAFFPLTVTRLCINFHCYLCCFDIFPVSEQLGAGLGRDPHRCDCLRTFYWASWSPLGLITCTSPALSGAAHKLRGGFQSCWTQTDIAFAGSPGAPEQHWHPSELHHIAPGSSTDHLWFFCREGRHIISPCAQQQDGAETTI